MIRPPELKAASALFGAILDGVEVEAGEFELA
jgi:hypothetical protein